MGTIRRNVIIENDGEIRCSGVPLKKGDEIELVIITDNLKVQPMGNRSPIFSALRISTSGFIFNREKANER